MYCSRQRRCLPTETGCPTLARKLDVVHRKTVTSSNSIPSVRLAKPPSPSFARHPGFDELLCDSANDAIDALKSPALSDKDLRRAGEFPGTRSPGIIGSVGAILPFPSGTARRIVEVPKLLFESWPDGGLLQIYGENRAKSIRICRRVMCVLRKRILRCPRSAHVTCRIRFICKKSVPLSISPGRRGSKVDQSSQALSPGPRLCARRANG